MEKIEKQDDQTYALIGAAMAVQSELSFGFLEAVYQEALAIEMTKRNIPFKQEVHVPIYFKGTQLKTTYKADFIAYDSVILELKALGNLTGQHQAQTLNYLKATNLHRALLFNFGTPKLQYHRLIF